MRKATLRHREVSKARETRPGSDLGKGRRAQKARARERTVLWGKRSAPDLRRGRGGRVRGRRFWAEGMGVGGGGEDADKGGGRQPSCFEKCFLFL